MASLQVLTRPAFSVVTSAARSNTATCFFMPVRVIWNFPARSVIEASARLSCSSTPRRVASDSAANEASRRFRYTEPCGSVYSRSTGGVQEETKPLGNGFPVRRTRGQRHDFPTHNPTHNSCSLVRLTGSLAVPALLYVVVKPIHAALSR